MCSVSYNSLSVDFDTKHLSVCCTSVVFCGCIECGDDWCKKCTLSGTAAGVFFLNRTLDIDITDLFSFASPPSVVSEGIWKRGYNCEGG